MKTENTFVGSEDGSMASGMMERVFRALHIRITGNHPHSPLRCTGLSKQWLDEMRKRLFCSSSFTSEASD